MAATAAELRLEGVSFRYPGAAIDTIREVSATFIADGSVNAVVAPSGAGKTTLLAILGGLLSPSSGLVTASVAGHLVHPTQVAAWILQTTNSLPRRSVLDNALLPLLACGTDLVAASARASAQLEALGLSSVQDQQARTLSGGELQRLSIARALLSDLPFLLADEPTGQLDDATTDHVVATMLNAVQASRATLLLVTHDRRLARASDRILRLDGGRLNE